jgi:hypothetical protein
MAICSVALNFPYRIGDNRIPLRGRRCPVNNKIIQDLGLDGAMGDEVYDMFN